MYKIIVYAISKNEEKFVNRWYESMKEADEIYVLDTGSTDSTVNKLKSLGVKVTEKEIKPWRFDVARNESLKLVCADADICVCTDLDEVFNVGWRKELESAWEKGTTKARYTYNWSLDKNNKPIVSFFYEKTHARFNYEWIHPVHEILKYTGNNEKKVTIPNLVLNHYPDNKKSRSSYLPLLELSVREDPENDRNFHYLGREYMYNKRWNDAIDTLIKHLNLKSATWKDERSASMRFISRCYINLNRYDEANMWLDKAIIEAPHLRDPLVEKALFEYKRENYDEVIKLLEKALTIPINEKYYINEPFTFDETTYDLLSVMYFKKNDKYKAMYYVIKALEINPDNKRIINNYKMISNM